MTVWTLDYGLTLNIDRSAAQLRSLATGETWMLRPEDVPSLTALALGIPNAQSEQHALLPTFIEGGWAVEAESTVDAFLVERLSTLNRRFSWSAPAGLEHITDLVVQAHARRRVFHRAFGQYAALPETVTRRCKLAGETPKRIIVLGDDDFLSIALAALGHDVTVVEIDPAIVTAIEELAPADAKIDIRNCDLRDPWPADFRGNFDICFADPLSGPIAMRLFISRALSSLRPDGLAYVCASERGCTTFERLRHSMDFELLEHFSDFNHYYSPLGHLALYTSEMMTICTNEHTQIAPAQDELLWSPGLSDEDSFEDHPASRYVFAEIDPDKVTLSKLKVVLEVLEDSGLVRTIHHKSHVEEGITSYLALLADCHAMHIRVHAPNRTLELFVSPAKPEVEYAVVSLLKSLFGRHQAVTQTQRLRDSSLTRILPQAPQ